MQEVEIFVAHKSWDLTALTAKHTLTHDMGYGEILHELLREDYWSIKISDRASKNIEKIAKEFISRVKLFVNPNKHNYWLRVNGTFLIPPPSLDVPPDVYRVDILTELYDDEVAHLALQSLRTTWGYGDIIRSVRRGVIWHLFLRASSPEDAKRIADEISLTHSINKGLLINPHAQSYKILQVS